WPTGSPARPARPARPASVCPIQMESVVSRARSSRGLAPGSNSQLAPALAELWIPATLGTSQSAGKCQDDRRIWVENFHLDRKGFNLRDDVDGLAGEPAFDDGDD